MKDTLLAVPVQDIAALPMAFGWIRRLGKTEITADARNVAFMQDYTMPDISDMKRESMMNVCRS